LPIYFDAIIDTTPVINENMGAPLRAVNVEGPIVASGKTLSEYYGVFAEEPSGSGTTTTSYGLYVGGTSATVTNKYALATEPTAGNVGIGTTTPTQMLDVNGKVHVATLPASGGSAVYESNGVLGLAASDERLKRKIELIPDALQKIRSVRGVTYEWQDMELGAGRRMGVIAQDVLKVAPELIYPVQHKGKEYYGVRNENLTALLIEAVKELAEQDSEHQSTIQQLQEDVRLLKSRLDATEQTIKLAAS
jgi:hypothetical protein